MRLASEANSLDLPGPGRGTSSYLSPRTRTTWCSAKKPPPKSGGPRRTYGAGSTPLRQRPSHPCKPKMASPQQGAGNHSAQPGRAHDSGHSPAAHRRRARKAAPRLAKRSSARRPDGLHHHKPQAQRCVGKARAGTSRSSKYCFQSDKPLLRLSFLAWNITVASATIGKFQDRTVPAALIEQGPWGKLDAKIVQLRTESLTAADFPVSDNLEKPISGSALAVVSLPGVSSRVDPDVPVSGQGAAHRRRVELYAVIGTDGKISAPQPVSSPSHLLTEAAMDAVRRWEYEPYLLKGKPVEVKPRSPSTSISAASPHLGKPTPGPGASQANNITTHEEIQ